jgi:hypothetical protein
MKRIYLSALSIPVMGAFVIGVLAKPALAAPKYEWPKGVTITSPSKGPKCSGAKIR